jgi:PAS domain S-box-containing protein
MATSAHPETRVLHVDDDPAFADLAADILERQRASLVVETATSAAEGLEVLADGTVDCVVSDYDMPGQNGIEFLETVREEYPDLPFILFTGKGSEEVAGEAISAGVTDYLQKDGGTDQYALLANRVVNAVGRARAERTRRRQLEAIEAAQEGIAILDADGHFTYVNETYAALYGYEPGELVGEHWELVYPDDEVGFAREEVVPTARDEGRWHGRTTGLRADGTTFPEDHVLSATEAGELVCTVRDVSGREEREQELTRYRRLTEAMGDPVYVLDADGYYTYVNDALVETFGYEREELLGEHASLIIPDPAFERGSDLIRELLADEDRQSVTWELENVTAEGEEVVVENHLALLPSADGEFRGTVGVVRDITEHRDRERDLRRYERMVNAMQEAACIYDEEGRFVVVNEYLADFYETTREALRGRKSDLIPAVREESDGDPYAELLAGEREQFRGRVTSEFPGRGTETLSYRLVPLTVEGETEGVVGVAREVTESRERERRLERQNERLEELASVVSHDLRNPLNVAQGRAKLARDGSDSVHLDAVVHALDRMEALVDDLLTLAREDGAVEGTEPVDLRRAVEGCWRTVDTARATLITDTGRVVRADSIRLQQLLENLLRNAVEHGGDGVTVRVGDLPDGFYVADDGPGVPLEARERVFQSGYSTREDGTGLGLAIVREVALAHGWTVTVTESADGGARFEVTGVEVA